MDLCFNRFEKLLEECVKSIDILKNAHAKGHPVPKCRTEERTLNTIKSATDSQHVFSLMVFIIISVFEQHVLSVGLSLHLNFW